MDHSGFKLQTVTDGYLETFNNTYTAETTRWWRASKEPLPDGGWAIVLETGCNNFLSCYPAGNLEAVIAANHALTGR